MDGLATRTVGPGTGQPARDRLVLVHGFGQTGRCWGPVEDDLAADHEVVLVDAPGHGGSGAWRGSFADGAAAIGAAGGPGTYVGYSMGGRYCLQLVLDRPDLVARLVLIGASPGLASAGERQARVEADEALAVRIEENGVAAFVDEWLALPMFAGLDASTRFEAERRTNTGAGLASSLRTAGTGAQPSSWDRLGELSMPVLLVTGGEDAKFTAIAREMAAAIPHATRVVIDGAGHTAHLERPTAFLATLRSWLHESRGREPGG